MKKFLFSLSMSLMAISLYSQITVDNFESGVNQGWGTVSSMGYTDVRVNEYKSGINLSDYVMFTQHASGDDNWAGAILNNYVKKGYKYLHAYIYRNNSNKPNLKVSDTNAQDLEPINPIVANQWQDVVFDISAYETTGTEFIFFMVDRTNVSELTWMLIDEIQLSNDATPRTTVVGQVELPCCDDNEYTLVWSDEFNGNSLDNNIWNIETNGDGGGNAELQFYCDRGVKVENGNLVLTATKENYNGKTCTSGRINSLGKVYFTYGKIEARIKMPKTANGLWPAFWMMGQDLGQVGWPQCGEIDIVEMGNINGINNGTQDRYFNGAYHWGTSAADHRQYARDYTASYSVQDGQFHTFTCEWDADQIAMFLDNATSPYCVMTIPKTSDNTAPGYYFHKPNFIIFNLAVGGNFPVIYDINNITALSTGSASMYVDYVRVYQKGGAGETFTGESSTGIMQNYENAEVISTQFYDLQGRLINESNLQKGIYVQRSILSNGTFITEKIIR